MYVCTYVCMYVCIYVHMFICIYVYISTCVYVYICIYVYLYMCICVYMYLCTYMLYICIYVYMYICVYMYTCIRLLIIGLVGKKQGDQFHDRKNSRDFFYPWPFWQLADRPISKRSAWGQDSSFICSNVGPSCWTLSRSAAADGSPVRAAKAAPCCRSCWQLGTLHPRSSRRSGESCSSSCCIR